jgi:hypothetical protein
MMTRAERAEDLAARYKGNDTTVLSDADCALIARSLKYYARMLRRTTDIQYPKLDEEEL